MSDLEASTIRADDATPNRSGKASTITVISGRSSGRIYLLDREVTIIGRALGCDVLLHSLSVSRNHAAIRKRTDNFMLEDIGSTRGTSLNGLRLTQPHLLSDGDTIQIGEVILIFNGRNATAEEEVPSTITDGGHLVDEDVDSVLPAVMVDHRSGGEADSDKRAPSSESAATKEQDIGSFASSSGGVTSPTDSINACVEIRSALESNNVNWDDAKHPGLIDEILKSDVGLLAALGTGFYRLVVLDAARGLGAAGLFDDHLFLEAVRAELVHSFGLQLDGTDFHIEDIFQMLKDEQRSLFCFANFQLIPVVHFRTVRAFTQGVHRVLLLSRGSRDIANEEVRGDRPGSVTAPNAANHAGRL